ncbi:MAG: cupin domain-containing protein [Caulobacter sp.]|nr:cupin domain-containing protein [Caulobacter sp.]
MEVLTHRLLNAPDAGMRLLTAAAASYRDQRPAAGEALGGRFLESEAAADLSEDAIEQTLARITALEVSDNRSRYYASAANAATRSLGELSLLPDPVKEAAFDAIGAGRRWGMAGFGIRRMALPILADCKVELLRIEPGAGVANHDHEDEEYTLVLTGAFHDGHARFAPGDINVGQPGFRHEPRAEAGQVCYALAVSYGAPAFEGPMGLLQRLTGFGR